jgi:enterochelin esterase-like enzyme
MHRVATSLFVAAVAAGCKHQPSGRLQYTEVASQAEGRTMRYGVYLPAGWDRTTPLPLVVLLHGAGDDETSADRAVVVEELDRAVASGQVPPFIMVTPDGDRGFWMNWYDGRHHYKDWVLDEVIPAVRDRYPTIGGSAGLHLMGVSMGGGGGMQMWLPDPSRFASATIISAPILDEAGTRKFLRRFMPNKGMDSVFGPEGSGQGVDPYRRLASPEALEGSRLIFGAATHDIANILDSNERFHQHLVQANVPHRFVTFSGRHGWRSWAPMFAYSLCYNLDDDCSAAPPKGWSVAVGP